MVIPTVAIHHGDDGTNEPASIDIKQDGRQKPFEESGVPTLGIGKTETAEPMAGMKKIQGGEPAAIGGGRTIHGNLRRTASFEGPGGQGELHGRGATADQKTIVRGRR